MVLKRPDVDSSGRLRYYIFIRGGQRFFAVLMETQNHTISEIKKLVEASGLKHIAFIMDGNGRWATRRSLPREAGHKLGADAFRKIVRYCGDIGIKAVTVYAFSTENWKRPEREVNAIMRLFETFLEEAAEEEEKNKIRVIFIGDKEGLPKHLAEKARELEVKTASYSRILNVALNYGGRAEIVHAVNKLIRQGKTVLTEEDLADAMYTSESGDPDLIVRTASEYRISNFLLWQAAYAEFYFTDTLWPDMKPNDVNGAVLEFSKRKRSMGGLIT